MLRMRPRRALPGGALRPGRSALGALILCLGLVAQVGLARAEPSGDASAEQRTQAERLFFQGQELHDAGNTQAALELFRKSYAAVPSPNSHLYIARCLRDLGRIAEAYAEYRVVLLEAAEAADADRYTMTLQAAARERASLKSRLGALQLEVPGDVAGIEVRVGGRVVPPAEWGQPILVDPGTVLVWVTAPQREGFRRNYEFSAGERRTVKVELPHPDFPSSPLAADAAEPRVAPSEPAWPAWRVLALSSAGVGLAGLATWGMFGIQAASRYDKVEAECGGPCGSTHHDEIMSGRRETLISQIGLAVGVAGLTGSVIAYSLGSRAKSAGSASVLRVGVSGAQLTWAGAF